MSGGAYTFVVPATRPGPVRDLVAQLLSQGVPTDGVIVVDDSRDGAVSRALGDVAVRTLRTDGSGQGVARNVGARAATSSWLVFLDDDVVPDDRLVSAMDATVAALGERDGRLGIIEAEVRPTGPLVRPCWRNRLVEAHRPGGYLTACLIVRRQAFFDGGGLVSRSRGGFREDTAFGLAVMDAGWTTAWSPTVRVSHPIEDINLRAFLRTAAFFRFDAWFRRRHPRYLESVTRKQRLLGIRVGNLRSRVPPGAVLAAVVLSCTGRRGRWAASAVIALGGAALNAAHLNNLGRHADPPPCALIDPREVLAHALWAVVAGCSRLHGELEIELHRLCRRPVGA